MTFTGEVWTRDLWYEWSAMLLEMQWEGAGQRMPSDWAEWSDFIGEWFRSLFNDGKAGGFVDYEKR